MRGTVIFLYAPYTSTTYKNYSNLFTKEPIIATGNRKAIEEEILTKVITAKQGGGYIYHSDHTIPYTVSLESYIFALECAKKYGTY